MRNLQIGIVLVILSLILGLACEKNGEEQAGADMIEQLRMLPRDVNLLAYVSVEKNRNSDVAQMFIDSLDQHPFRDREYQEFLDSTNFDIHKDINEFYVAGKFGKHHEEAGIIVVFGNFESEKIMDYIKLKNHDDDLILENYENLEVYHLNDMSSDKDKVFCFVDGNRLVAGSEAYVKSWIDFSLGEKKPEELSPEVMERVQHLKFKNDGWAIILAESAVENMMMHSDVTNLDGLKDVKYLNMSFRLSDRVEFCGELECSNPEKASLFRDTIKGAVSTAKLSVSDDRSAVDVLNKIDISLNANRVEIDFRMSKQDIEKLMNKRGVLL